MKKMEWINPNKMLFESLHKTFNKQTNYISTGNVIANTQVSSFIRPEKEIECNHSIFNKGHLQEFDLKPFIPKIPKGFLKTVKELTNQNNGAILYEFFHCIKNMVIIDGYVLTDKNYKLLTVYPCKLNDKTESVLSEAIKYITQ